MKKLSLDATPRFKRGYRLQHDKVRQQWIIQAPERALIADPIAAAVLQHVDGIQNLNNIIDTLAATFDASRETISNDVIFLLSELVEKGVLHL